MTFTLAQIEELKQYFMPVIEEVNQLPKTKDASDNALIILKVSGIKKLYIMNDGIWKFLINLS